MFRKHLAARKRAEQMITDAIREFEAATGHSVDEIELDVLTQPAAKTLWRVNVLESPVRGTKQWQDPLQDPALPDGVSFARREND